MGFAKNTLPACLINLNKVFHLLDGGSGNT